MSNLSIKHNGKLKPTDVSLGKVAKNYLYHRSIREQEDLLRRAEGDTIRNMLVELGLTNKVVEFEGKYYKCFAIFVEEYETYDVPDDVLLKYIPKDILCLYKQYKHGFSYGYAQDVTIEVRMENAEKELEKDD